MPADSSEPPQAAGALPRLPAHLDPRGRHHRAEQPSRAVLHWVRLGAQGLAATLSVLLVVTFGLYWWKFHAFNVGLHRLTLFGASADKPRHDIDGKDRNLLIVGNDDRSTASDAELKELSTGRDGGSLNTDTMMIVHVPANGAKATLISLPRDSYVAIRGYGMGKLNSAYPDAYTATGGSATAKRTAGAALLVDTIQRLTGLTVDSFVQVDLLGFYRISNAIGGVRVNMCSAVQEPKSGINLHKGINTIEGKQALAFVRQRYDLPNGDLDRVQRQRYFLTAAFRRLVSAGTLLNPLKLQRLLTAVQSSISIDERLNPTDLAAQMQNLSADNVVGQTIPTDGFGTTDDGQSIVKVSPSEVQTFVNRLIGGADSKLGTAGVLAPSTVTVDVKNGSGVDGAATQNADVLRQQGFVIGSTGSAATPSASTVIQYSDGMQAQAKTVAAYVPGATLQKVAAADHVTLLLGADHITAKAKPTQAATPTATPKPKAKPIDSGCIN